MADAKFAEELAAMAAVRAARVAPVTSNVEWDVNRKPLTVRYMTDYEYKLDDARIVKLHQKDHSLGTCVWTAGIALAKYLEHHKDMLASKRVVELGSGTGVVGIVAAAVGATHVTLTDLEDVVPYLQANVDLNAELIGASKMTAQALPWGDASTVDPGPCDIIIGSDLIHIPELPPLLLATLKTLLKPTNCFLYAYDLRGRAGGQDFIRQLREQFEVRDIPRSEQHPSFVFDEVALLQCSVKLV